MQFGHLKRREFISLLGGAVATWPIAASAQQGERMRRIGVLSGVVEIDRDGQARTEAFLQTLQQLGWTDGRNVRIDVRWTGGEADDTRKYAKELVALAPDVILATGGSVVAQLLQVTRTVPIVFAQVTDPVGAGFVDSLAQPGGNATGFTNFEYGISGKWLELLKEIVPRVTRVAVLRDPALPGGVGQLGAIQGAAPSFGVEVSPVGVRDAAEIERVVAAFARGSNAGLIVLTSALTRIHRDLITKLAAQHRLPAVYSDRTFVASGGLTSYGPDRTDHFRRAAGYVDRILKGEKPANLPVQAPTKYELVINLKAAKALGLEVPATLLARADEVIE
jgi:putative ABC transport system substrate-binding protein